MQQKQLYVCRWMSRYDWLQKKRKNLARKNKGMNIQLTLSRWNRSDAAVDESETERGKYCESTGIKKAGSAHIWFKIILVLFRSRLQRRKKFLSNVLWRSHKIYGKVFTVASQKKIEMMMLHDITSGCEKFMGKI